MFDVLILVAPKDFNKLPFVCESIIKNLKGQTPNFYFVSPCAIPDEYRHVDGQYLMDREVIDYDFTKITNTHRQGWYRQQFIKLFQAVTSDNYLVIDADIWIANHLFIITNKPTFFLGRQQHHLPYFRFMKEVLNLDKVYPYSFISEIMLFQRWRIQHLIASLEVDETEFIDICVNKINEIGDNSSFSEYELYGNYVMKTWPYDYKCKQLKVLSQHKNREWTQEELQNNIEANRAMQYDILTMHTWL